MREAASSNPAEADQPGQTPPTGQTGSGNEPASDRADPTFKHRIHLVFDRLGIEEIKTEFPQVTRADLILHVPDGLSLENTLFSFFKPWVILEFKGDSDKLGVREFVINQVRIDLLYLQLNKDRLDPGADFENILNLFVTARHPDALVEYAASKGYQLKPVEGQEWLLWGNIGFQEVAVVVCNLLPIEPKYYDLLLFAPAGGSRWKEFVRTLAREGNRELLDIIRNMKPKEFKKMSLEIEELLAAKSPAEKRQYEEDWVEAIEDVLPRLGHDLQKKILKDTVNEVTPETKKEVIKEAVAELDPQAKKEVIEALYAGLSEEQRQELRRLLAQEGENEKNS